MVIRLEGPDEELRQLLRWLRNEDELRGRVSMRHLPIEDGDMGGAAEAVTIALANGTAVTAAVTSLFGWLRHRRETRKVSLTVQRDDSGEQVSLECGSADDAQQVLDRVEHFFRDGE